MLLYLRRCFPKVELGPLIEIDFMFSEYIKSPNKARKRLNVKDENSDIVPALMFPCFLA